MKLLIKILILFTFANFLFSQEKKVILGEFNWNQWKIESGWKKIDTCIYLINKDTIQLLNSKFNSEINIEIFAGSWCGDSESELPKIIKIFDSINFTNYKIFGVDRDKNLPNMYSKFRNVEKVPTVIILRKFDELGRVIEFPENSRKNWEEAFLKIIP